MLGFWGLGLRVEGEEATDAEVLQFLVSDTADCVLFQAPWNSLPEWPRKSF